MQRGNAGSSRADECARSPRGNGDTAHGEGDAAERGYQSTDCSGDGNPIECGHQAANCGDTAGGDGDPA